MSEVVKFLEKPALESRLSKAIESLKRDYAEDELAIDPVGFRARVLDVLDECLPSRGPGRPERKGTTRALELLESGMSRREISRRVLGNRATRALERALWKSVRDRKYYRKKKAQGRRRTRRK